MRPSDLTRVPVPGKESQLPPPGTSLLPTALVQDYYRRFHPEGSFRAPGDHPLLYRTLARTLGQLAIARLPLVDVGCGQGFFLSRVKRRFPLSVGLEFNEQGVRDSRAHSDCPIVRGDAQQLPFRSDSAGVVVALDLVEHLADPEHFFREAYRVLISCGILCCRTPNPESWGHRRKGRKWFGYRDPTHIQIQPIDYWRSLLAATGFSVIKDGTDWLWDVPYLACVHHSLQRLVFIGTKHVVDLLRVCLPWRLGENYVCIAQKSSLPPRA